MGNEQSYGAAAGGGYGGGGGYGYGYSGGGFGSYHQPKRREGKHPERGQNARFWRGESAHPGTGAGIEAWLAQRWGDYPYLERAHNWVQFAFPIYESSGMAMESEALGKREAALLRGDWRCAVRFVRMYRLVLNFFGFRLTDLKAGTVERHPDKTFWRDRFRNLVEHPHNNLRISRILICLGEMGFSEWKQPFLDALEQEVMVNKTMRSCQSSYERFWSRLVDHDDPWYIRKTLEESDEHRGVSIFHTYRDSPGKKPAFDEALRELEKEEAIHEKLVARYCYRIRRAQRLWRIERNLYDVQRAQGGERRRSRKADAEVDLEADLTPNEGWDDDVQDIPPAETPPAYDSDLDREESDGSDSDSDSDSGDKGKGKGKGKGKEEDDGDGMKEAPSSTKKKKNKKAAAAGGDSEPSGRGGGGDSDDGDGASSDSDMGSDAAADAELVAAEAAAATQSKKKGAASGKKEDDAGSDSNNTDDDSDGSGSDSDK